MSGHCVIVGGGHAAAQLCTSLRKKNWPGRITLIGDEPSLPYHRPPLSKTQLDPSQVATRQLIRPEGFYADQEVEVLLGNAVTGIDRTSKTVEVANRKIQYDQLVLATGSLHRLPAIPGVKHPRVFTLRTADEAAAIRKLLPATKKVVVIGAGFIGLEVAASLRKLGIEVVVLELSDRVLSRVTCPVVSTYFEDLHRERGVDIRTNVAATAIADHAEALNIQTESNDSFLADFVVVGTGAYANCRLAVDAGLAVDKAIVVDSYNRTSDQHIYAMGDCCTQEHPLYGGHMRLESVQNANDQAKTVAEAISGTPRPNTALPWFWSDQYEVKLQIAGVSEGYDHCVVRGKSTSSKAFSVWYFRDNRLIAADAINDTRAYAAATRLIQLRRSPSSTDLSDESIHLKDILQTAEAKEHV